MISTHNFNRPFPTYHLGRQIHSSCRTIKGDDATQKHPQSLCSIAVPMGRNVGTVDTLSLPSRPTLLLCKGQKDGKGQNAAIRGSCFEIYNCYQFQHFQLSNPSELGEIHHAL
jgi:hypothetical protein